MSEKGAPPRAGKTGKEKTPARLLMDELIADCMADPGEWYSIPILDDANPDSAGSSMRLAIQVAVSDISLKANRIWVRYHGGQK